MLYGIETVAFDCLIECDVTRLPVDVVRVADDLGCIVSSYRESEALIEKFGMSEYCKTHDAASVVYKGQRYILISGALGYERKHYAIAHEIGHMKMHYDISGTILGQTENPEERAKQELEADTFALALLAPAPVLHKIGAMSTEQIARVTMLESTHASKVRDKISTLELTSKDDPLYRPVCNQFSKFISQFNAKEKQRTFSLSYIFQAIFALSFAALVVLIFTARPATQPATSSLVELTTSQEIESASTSDNVSVASKAASTSSKPAASAASSKPATSAKKTVYYVQPMPTISTAPVIPKASSSRVSSAAPAVTAPKSGAQVYYWTAGGDKYHIDPNCYSLKNAKYPVQHGSIQDAANNGKKDPCRICTDKS